MEIEQHIVNLSAGGRLRATGALHTPPDLLKAHLERFGASGTRSLTLYFHGGLVSEAAGLEQARALYPELMENAQSWPLFVLWESGALETLQGTLLEITQASPLFNRLFQKLLKHVARKLPGLPAFEAADGALQPAEIARAALEADRLPAGDPAALLALEPPPGAPVEPVTDAEVAALQADLAADPVAAGALDAILANAAHSAPAGVAGEAAPASGPATGYLSADLLAELRASAPPPGAEAELISAAALWAFAGRILRAVIGRYRAGTDHGLAGTVLEEIYRTAYADRVGTFLWERIKQNARRAYDDLPAGTPSDDTPGGTLLIALLRDEIAARGPIDLHLVGHSAGSIHICHFMERAARDLGDSFSVRSVVLTAPACTCDLFLRTLAAHSARIDALRIFTMEDALERRDPLVKWLPLAYPHSLLYLVSGLLEGNPDTPLLGLARHVRGAPPAGVADSPAAAVRAWLAARPGALVLARTADDAPAGARAAFASHYGEGGPLQDRATLDSIAQLLRPPPATDLEPIEVEVTEDIARLLEMPPPPRPRLRQDGPAGGLDVMEAIIGEDDLIDHALLKGLLFAGRAVARLVVQGVQGFFSVPPDQRADAWRQAAQGNALIQGYGTGWVFGRARRLLMTNNHVLPLPAAAQSATVEFGYERDIRVGARPQLVLRLDPAAFFLTSPNMAFDGLDYTLVALSRPAPEEIGYLEPVQGITAAATQSIFVVQHPRGNPKTYVLNHNRKVNITDRYVTYISDTLEGSSGSPLFDDSLRLVGIHHVGNFRVTLGSQQELTNLGSRIEVVMQDMVSRLRAGEAGGGWDEARVREWFGDGPLLNLWRATE